MNSSPALNSALEELAKCGGGTLEIGHGKFKLETTVSKNFFDRASKITIRGQGSNSQIIFATGPDADGLVLQNLEDLTIQGITFVGSPNLLSDGSPNPAAGSDVFRALHLQSVLRARIERNMFYGIAAPAPGAAVIKAVNCYLTVDHNQFLGSAASQSGVGYGGVILADNHIGVSIVNNSFIDYGVLNGVYYSKTPLVWSTAWVVLMNPSSAEAENARSNNPVEIAYNQFDEGAMYAIINSPESGATITRHMKLAYNTMNVGIAGGYYLNRIKHLEIKGGWAGYRSLSGELTEVNAIILKNVEFATIRNFETDPTKSATGLSVDAGTAMLRIVDSKFKTIVNDAKAWRIEDGALISSSPPPPPGESKGLTSGLQNAGSNPEPRGVGLRQQ
ncbi:MAG TPA: hypothetical protein VJS64_08445 [Pyrinomonadaceae bacterium]|nr:hypothetical protein [Pyrinomonadaceae bacterium]